MSTEENEILGDAILEKAAEGQKLVIFNQVQHKSEHNADGDEKNEKTNNNDDKDEKIDELPTEPKKEITPSPSKPFTNPRIDSSKRTVVVQTKIQFDALDIAKGIRANLNNYIATTSETLNRAIGVQRQDHLNQVNRLTSAVEKCDTVIDQKLERLEKIVKSFDKFEELVVRAEKVANYLSKFEEEDELVEQDEEIKTPKVISNKINNDEKINFFKFHCDT